MKARSILLFLSALGLALFTTAHPVSSDPLEIVRPRAGAGCDSDDFDIPINAVEGVDGDVPGAAVPGPNSCKVGNF
ncbi:hypothetical protein VTO73DRAFT_9373 [Trametes versicolor]